MALDWSKTTNICDPDSTLNTHKNLDKPSTINFFIVCCTLCIAYAEHAWCDGIPLNGSSELKDEPWFVADDILYHISVVFMLQTNFHHTCEVFRQFSQRKLSCSLSFLAIFSLTTQRNLAVSISGCHLPSTHMLCSILHIAHIPHIDSKTNFPSPAENIRWQHFPRSFHTIYDYVLNFVTSILCANVPFIYCQPVFL